MMHKVKQFLVIIFSYLFISTMLPISSVNADETNPTIQNYSLETNDPVRFAELVKPYVTEYKGIKILDLERLELENANPEVLRLAYQYNATTLAENGIKSREEFNLYYGRYCGPKLSGPGNPVDDLDAICRTHDRCYGKHGYFNRKCDLDFFNALKRNSHKWRENRKKYDYANGAMAFFALRLAIG